MSTDRELLMLAAKADGRTGFVFEDHRGLGFCTPGENPVFWNPLTDDGDEARLESALGLWVCWYPEWVLVGPEVYGHTGSACGEYFGQHAGDKQAARRLAGVRAAAEIGERMP